MIYFQLFLSFFQIGLFSFGGGYAAMPLIQGQVVQGHGWRLLGHQVGENGFHSQGIYHHKKVF